MCTPQPLSPPGRPVSVDTRTLDKVRKLLAKAEHPATPAPEAEALSEKAAEIMARHSIDRAMIEARTTTGTPLLRTVDVPAPYAVPKSVLLSRVGEAYAVQTVIGGRPDGDGRRCTIVGFVADLDITELLFTSLLLQATTAMFAALDERATAPAFRRAFLFGYAARIGERLAAARERAVAETSEAADPTGASTALVLADRKDEVARVVAEAFPRLGSLRTRISDGNGLLAGHRAASAANLTTGGTVGGGARRALG
jgi:hypothetical protein